MVVLKLELELELGLGPELELEVGVEIHREEDACGRWVVASGRTAVRR